MNKPDFVTIEQLKYISDLTVGGGLVEVLKTLLETEFRLSKKQVILLIKYWLQEFSPKASK
jgi:hypothetical protein